MQPVFLGQPSEYGRQPVKIIKITEVKVTFSFLNLVVIVLLVSASHLSIKVISIFYVVVEVYRYLAQ